MSTFKGSTMSGAAFTKQTAGAFPYTLLRDLKPNLKCREVVKNLIPHRALGECYAVSGGRQDRHHDRLAAARRSRHGRLNGALSDSQ